VNDRYESSDWIILITSDDYFFMCARIPLRDCASRSFSG
jgi:hypothetical protein